MTTETDPTVAVWTVIADVAAALSRVNVPLEMIAERTGLDPSEVDEAVSQLGEVGLVASWNPGEGPVATLTPLAAARLGLKLRRFDGKAGMEWIPVNRSDPGERRRPKRVFQASALRVDLDKIPGDAPRPDQIAEATEAVESMAPRPGRRLPDSATAKLLGPSILIEGCASVWRETNGGRCTACKGLPLARSTYCLRCSRWGLDWLLDRIWAAERRAAAAKGRNEEARTFAERHAGVA